MALYRRILTFSLSFVVGVGIVTVVARTWDIRIPLAWAWGLYATAATAGAAAFWAIRRHTSVRADTAAALEGPATLITVDEREEAIRRTRRSEGLVLAGLFVTGILLGAARFVHRAYIPDFVNDPDRPQHLASILRAFPDVARTDVTTVRGRISAEPEWSPDRSGEGGPGFVEIVVDPTEVIPDPDAGVAYRVAAGSVMVRLSPRSHDVLERDEEFGEVFRALALGRAYADEIEVTGTFRVPQGAANPGLFDAESFYGDQDIFAQCYVSFWNRSRPPILLGEEGWGLRTFGIPGTEALDPFPLALALKERMISALKATTPHPESAFLAGIVLGMRYGLNGLRCPFETPPAEGEIDRRHLVLDEFRWSGTSHVLSVSGLHVTIIAVFLSAIFEGCRIRRRVYAPFVCVGLVVFCLITGARPATVRSTLMNGLVLLTYAYGGGGLKASFVFAIAISACVILMENPKWLFQPAYSLSFMAVLSLALLTPPWSVVLKGLSARLVHPWWRPIRAALYEAFPSLARWAPTAGNYGRDFLASQCAITMGMMGPLSLYYFTRFSVAGPVANAVAIPLTGIITQVGMLQLLLALVPWAGPYLALPFGAVNWLLNRFFAWTAHVSTYLPFPWAPTLEPRHLLLYYALCALFAFRRPIFDAVRLWSIQARLSPDRTKLRRFRLRAMLAVLAGAACVVACLVEIQDRRLEVNVLSVGYGTAVHIRTPSGAQIVVDGGGFDPRFGVDQGDRTVAPYLLQRRVRRLDAAVLASLRPEDVAGLATILRIFPTDRLFAPVDLSAVPEAAHETGAWAVRRVAAAVRDPWDLRRWGQSAALAPVWTVLVAVGLRSPSVEVVEGGTVIYEEATPGGMLAIMAVHPPPGFDGGGPADRSIVLKITHGERSILLAHGVGAAGAEALARTIVEGEAAARADVVVLPAHGSAEPVPRAFLDRAGPRYAIASYRYPSGAGRGARTEEGRLADLLEHLRARGVETFRTDENGAVRILSDGREISVVPTLGARAPDEERRDPKVDELF